MKPLEKQHNVANQLWIFTFIGVGFLFVAMPTCEARSKDDGTLVKQIQEMIAKIRTSKTPEVRADAAEHLADLTREIQPKDVDDKTFNDLVSLMDSTDDSVRAGVAAALGFLGPRARPAVPKLLEILPKVDCLNGTITSADAIRYALKRIGVTPPPRPDCNRIGG